VVCLSQPILVMISSRVVPPSRFSMAITWLVLAALAGRTRLRGGFGRLAYWEDQLDRSINGEDVECVGFSLDVLDRIVERAEREMQETRVCR
jgi:hypothetical protein